MRLKIWALTCHHVEHSGDPFLAAQTQVTARLFLSMRWTKRGWIWSTGENRILYWRSEASVAPSHITALSCGLLNFWFLSSLHGKWSPSSSYGLSFRIQQSVSRKKEQTIKEKGTNTISMVEREQVGRLHARTFISHYNLGSSRKCKDYVCSKAAVQFPQL